MVSKRNLINEVKQMQNDCSLLGTADGSQRRYQASRLKFQTAFLLLTLGGYIFMPRLSVSNTY